MTTMTSGRRVRRHLAVWAVLPVLAVGAACGGDNAESTSGEPTSSESSSQAQESAEPTVHDEKTLVPALKAAVEESPSAKLDMKMSGPVSMTATGSTSMGDTFADTSMDMTMEMQGQKMQIKLVDQMLYMQAQGLTPKGKWLGIDPTDTSNPAAAQFKSLAQSGSLSSTFDAFEAGLKGVKHLGEGKIDGETMQKYELTVDTQKAMKAQGMQVPQSAAQSMPKSLTYEVWLDEKDLMRRVTMELQGMKILINVTDWGVPVEVEAPPKKDVVQQPGG